MIKEKKQKEGLASKPDALEGNQVFLVRGPDYIEFTKSPQEQQHLTVHRLTAEDISWIKSYDKNFTPKD